MQGVKVARTEMERLGRILLIVIVIISTISMGKPAGAAERLVYTAEIFENLQEISSFIQLPFEAGPPVILSFTKVPVELKEGEIFNHSGRSYSGIISSSPLGQSIEMTGYGQWPEEFTVSQQAFSGGVYDGEHIWMIPYRANQVIRFHPETGQMLGYSNWPAGFDPGPDSFANGAFLGGVYDGEYIWMIPYNANMVVRLNPQTGDMQSYADWPADVNFGAYKFSGGVYDGESIILIPQATQAVIELNPATGEMASYQDWPAGLQWGLNGHGFSSNVFDGTNVWMIPYEANQLVKFNTLTKEMTGYADAPPGVDLNALTFASAAYDGTRIWMAPLTTQFVLAVDVATGDMTRYEIWPEGENYTGSSYNSMFYDGEALWLIPYNQDAFMRIDPETGTTSLYKSWPEGFSKGFASFMSGVSDGQNLWAIPYFADQIIKISPVPVPAYSVTYEPNGAVSGLPPVDPVRYEEGGAVTVMGNSGGLNRPGYQFDGWSLLPTAIVPDYVEDSSFIMGSTDVALYAVWSELPVEPPVTYAVTYDSNGALGGTVPVDPERYEEGEAVTVKGNSGGLNRPGYQFAGWSLSATVTETVYSEGDTFTMANADAILYAVWDEKLPPEPEPEPETSWLRYDSNGASSGSVPADERAYKTGEQVMVEGNTGQLNKSGYRFAGWNTSPDGSGIAYQSGDLLTIGRVDITLFARWIRNPDLPNPPIPPVPPQPPAPEQNEQDGSMQPRSVSIHAGSAELAAVLYRYSNRNGRITDELTITGTLVERLKQALGNNQDDHLKVIFSLAGMEEGEVDTDEFVIKVTPAALEELGQLSLELEFQYGQVRQIIHTGQLTGRQTSSTSTLLSFITSKAAADNEQVKAFLIRLEEGRSSIRGGAASLLVSKTIFGAAITERVGQLEALRLLSAPVIVSTDELFEGINSKLVFEWNKELKQKELYVYLQDKDGAGRLIQAELDMAASTDSQIRLTVPIQMVNSPVIVAVVQTVSPSEEVSGTKYERYINGYEDGTFRPSRSLTRAELAALIARWATNPAAEGSGQQAEPMLPFQDVHADHWAAETIEQLNRMGIMTGAEEGMFYPDQAVTRAEFAMVAARWQQLADGSAGAFPDVLGHWAEQAVAAVHEQGWMQGYEDGTYRPDQSLTRAEAVVTLNRILNRPAFLHFEGQSWSDVPPSHWAWRAIESAARTFEQ